MSGRSRIERGCGEAIVDLLDTDTWVRRAAVEAVALDRAGRYALRDRLLADRHGAVRAAAAERLARAARSIFDDDAPTRSEAVRWFIDALDDSLPSVREPVCRAIARHGEPHEALERRLTQLIRRDPAWRVRRAAARALAAVGGAAAIPTLVAALEDPFWRVRHGLIEALSLIVTRSTTDADEQARLRQAVLEAGAQLDESARAALAYLAGGWPEGEDDVPAALGIIRDPGAGLELSDPDPAVVTARLLASRTVAPEELVPLLAESHVPLREEAARRLARLDDPRALIWALAWLEDPRLPNAPAATRRLLERLGSRAEPLAAHAILHGRPGALVWAAGWVGTYAASHLHEALRAWAGHPREDVRVAVIAALGRIEQREQGGEGQDGSRERELLLAALDDRSELVRDAAAQALGPEHIDAGSLHRFGPDVRAAWIEARGDLELARTTLLDTDEHVRVRVAALRAGRSDPALRRRARADADPWLRRHAVELAIELAVDQAVELPAERVAEQPVDLDLAAAIEMLTGEDEDEHEPEPDPGVRRMAARVLVRARAQLDPDTRAALRRRLLGDASRGWAPCADPWLRARAVELVDPRDWPRDCDDAALAELLLATRESVAMVRAAASAVLDAVPNLADRLERLLATDAPTRAPELDIAAWSRRSTTLPPEQAAARIDHALAQPGSPVVHAHLRELAVLFGADAPASHRSIDLRDTTTPPVTASPPTPSIERRRLGELELAPLVISGRFLPTPSSLAQAVERGVDTLFWEPRYATMTRFLRQPRRKHLQVIAGSFHADRAALVRDVELARHRLERDCIDLFLLFWVRSVARLSAEALDTLRELQARGWIRSYGFSTHDRTIGQAAIETSGVGAWPVIMTRHSAAHDGAERELLPAAAAAGVSVLGFSALCYGRMLRSSSVLPAGPPVIDCYRYTLSQPAVAACISAPQNHRELVENLAVLDDPQLPPARQELLRAHGREVYADNKRFDRLLRRGGAAPLREAILELFEAAEATDATDATDTSEAPS